MYIWYNVYFYYHQFFLFFLSHLSCVKHHFTWNFLYLFLILVKCILFGSIKYIKVHFSKWQGYLPSMKHIHLVNFIWFEHFDGGRFNSKYLGATVFSDVVSWFPSVNSVLGGGSPSTHFEQVSVDPFFVVKTVARNCIYKF